MFARKSRSRPGEHKAAHVAVAARGPPGNVTVQQGQRQPFEEKPQQQGGAQGATALPWRHRHSRKLLLPQHRLPRGRSRRAGTVPAALQATAASQESGYFAQKHQQEGPSNDFKGTGAAREGIRSSVPSPGRPGTVGPCGRDGGVTRAGREQRERQHRDGSGTAGAARGRRGMGQPGTDRQTLSPCGAATGVWGGSTLGDIVSHPPHVPATQDNGALAAATLREIPRLQKQHGGPGGNRGDEEEAMKRSQRRGSDEEEAMKSRNSSMEPTGSTGRGGLRSCHSSRDADLLAHKGGGWGREAGRPRGTGHVTRNSRKIRGTPAKCRAARDRGGQRPPGARSPVLVENAAAEPTHRARARPCGAPAHASRCPGRAVRWERGHGARGQRGHRGCHTPVSQLTAFFPNTEFSLPAFSALNEKAGVLGGGSLVRSGKAQQISSRGRSLPSQLHLSCHCLNKLVIRKGATWRFETPCAGSSGRSPHHQGQNGRGEGGTRKPQGPWGRVTSTVALAGAGSPPRSLPAPGALPSRTLYRTRSCSPSRSVVPSGRISFTKAMEKIRSLLSLAGGTNTG